MFSLWLIIIVTLFYTFSVSFAVQSKTPTSLTITWPRPQYTTLVRVEWERKETILCQQNSVSHYKNVSVNITEVPYAINGLEVYTRYNVTVCIVELSSCHSVVDTTGQLGNFEHPCLLLRC